MNKGYGFRFSFLLPAKQPFGGLFCISNKASYMYLHLIDLTQMKILGRTSLNSILELVKCAKEKCVFVGGGELEASDI